MATSLVLKISLIVMVAVGISVLLWWLIFKEEKEGVSQEASQQNIKGDSEISQTAEAEVVER